MKVYVGVGVGVGGAVVYGRGDVQGCCHRRPSRRPRLPLLLPRRWCRILLLRKHIPQHPLSIILPNFIFWAESTYFFKQGTVFAIVLAFFE